MSFLVEYAKRLGDRPIVLPNCDKHALMLAKHAPSLTPFCRIWTTEYSALASLINKDSLYKIAAQAGLPTVPSVCEPSLDDVAAWSLKNPAPYFIKPSYEGIESSKLRQKNLLIEDRDALLNYVSQHGATSLIVQRMLAGGDGYIFDCYGLCDKDGRIVTITSHRRWRQHLPDFGATCFGEIPASGLSKEAEGTLFERTATLLHSIRYHGIFGIEWLLEKETGNFYIIDFNARPFTTISHLQACGLNLPALAYSELVDEDVTNKVQTLQLRHFYWVDLLKDIESFAEKYRKGQIQIMDWIMSLLRCRSFAYWDWLDPVPGLHRLKTILSRIMQYPVKRISTRDLPVSQTRISEQ